jgi:hypothetical protein
LPAGRRFMPSCASFRIAGCFMDRPSRLPVRQWRQTATFHEWMNRPSLISRSGEKRRPQKKQRREAVSITMPRAQGGAGYRQRPSNSLQPPFHGKISSGRVALATSKGPGKRLTSRPRERPSG